MKFVLHGGATRDKNLVESNRAFFLEMIKGLEKPRVLLVYFAREPHEYGELTQDDTNNFTQADTTTRAVIKAQYRRDRGVPSVS